MPKVDKEEKKFEKEEEKKLAVFHGDLIRMASADWLHGYQPSNSEKCVSSVSKDRRN